MIITKKNEEAVMALFEVLSPNICLKKLTEAIQTLCLDSQYPSHATGTTVQVNLPSTKIGVGCVTITRMDKPKELQHILTFSSMSKKHYFSAQDLVYYHNTTLKPWKQGGSSCLL